MALFIILALLNGVCIGLSRVINGRLSVSLNAMKASCWNHLIGFIFLSILLFIVNINQEAFYLPQKAPLIAFADGIIGVLFVALNSLVFPKLGATRTTLLVVSGQMMVGVMLTLSGQTLIKMLCNLAGVALILLGIFLNKTQQDKP
ncbi:DMT family transporter [Photobacterium sp. 1_MG-2023]|uniref:DMT family transporter n=1 Tax=Photobacterium sp. 1_MG-2023 TaxID=3062646 RepID=UPI0026E16068|nr:DMT family transporter [Photobacterium sp. 1_MG-2023]MDO6706886.1 DMT family transporter [Photobacterium sp. 1_MG-2023]